jgi:acetylornithine deacetylase/succinyl-diaminopimelate desuccinylase-like protein
MPLRKDPMPAAATIISALPRHCAARGGSTQRLAHAMHAIVRRAAAAVPDTVGLVAAAAFAKLPMALVQWLQGLWVALGERAAQPYAVCTVGSITVWPGASNVIAKTVNFTVDLRSEDDAGRVRLERWLQRALQAECHAAGLHPCAASRLHAAPVVHSSVALTEALTSAAVAAHRTHAARGALSAAARVEELVQPRHAGASVAAGVTMTVPHMTSGAGHDALAMADVAPVAMLFVRCRGGLSHCPEEFVAPDDVVMATRVLFELVRRDAGL